MTGVTVVGGHPVTGVTADRTLNGRGHFAAFYTNPSFRDMQHVAGHQSFSRAQHARSIQLQILGDLVPGEEGRVTIPAQRSANHPQDDP
jgi:hypothetical protein